MIKNILCKSSGQIAPSGGHRMMGEWIKYTGSPAQLALIMQSKTDIAYIQGNEQYTMPPCHDRYIVKNVLLVASHFLICNPHPLADMICQQARTGQPVWWRSIEGGATGLCYKFMPPFAHPDTFEYSFTEFKEEA